MRCPAVQHAERVLLAAACRPSRGDSSSPRPDADYVSSRLWQTRRQPRHKRKLAEHPGIRETITRPTTMLTQPARWGKRAIKTKKPSPCGEGFLLSALGP